MDRRRFLQWLGGTAAGVAASHVLDVERLLWVPGEKTIFLPPVVEAGPCNMFLTPDWIARDALRILKQNLRFATHVDRADDWGIRTTGGGLWRSR